MQNQDMLAFTYRIQKIIRDMKFLSLPAAKDQQAREAIIAQLAAVQEHIEQAFSG